MSGGNYKTGKKYLSGDIWFLIFTLFHPFGASWFPMGLSNAKAKWNQVLPQGQELHFSLYPPKKIQSTAHIMQPYVTVD